MITKRVRAGVTTVVMGMLALGAVVVAAQPAPESRGSGVNSGSTDSVSVTISGGLETDPRDNGRPVVLIASMLGVTPDVFREAFSGVTPSRSGAPSGEQARANKQALLKVLAPYGISNEKLDQVSDYYRYKAALGETWPHSEATAVAIVVGGKITGIRVTHSGVGYTSIPTVVIRQGTKTYTGLAVVSYTSDFETNGSITAISIQQ